MIAELHVYGIRHHGPGSARAVLAALERDRPAVLAIELPADLESELAHVGEAGLVPPVALVAYDAKDVRRALYYPLARFSPEWVAMRWAAANGARVVPVDLPAGLMLARDDLRRQRLDRGHPSARERAVRADPLGELARLAGYSDRERWWERTFELQTGGAQVFPAVAKMIAALREAYPEATDAECGLREAHMARVLSALRKRAPGSVAVVCGAWHAPALGAEALKRTAEDYRKQLGSLRARRLRITWIPWTYERLRTAAGYGAGVVSPVWYQLLFDDARRASEHYLALIARELRAQGLPGSTAQVIAAAELAESLRKLRGLALAGLDEIEEAALGSLAEGSPARLAQVRTPVQSLKTAGRVPASLTKLPLLLDLEAQLRATRLSKHYQDMEPGHRQLDLRKPSHLLASQLLHRLSSIDVPFGRRLPIKEGAMGTFKEEWALHWQPEFALRLLAAHVDGQTVRGVAVARLRATTQSGSSDLLTLTAAVDQLILSGLFEELDGLARCLRRCAAGTVDVWIVARSLPALVRLARYQSLRLRESAYLTELIDSLVPKLAAGLQGATADIDDEAAYGAFGILKRVHPYLTMLNASELTELWFAALLKCAHGKTTHPLLAGFAVRAVADAGAIPAAEAARNLRAALKHGVALRRASLFVEGFLHSSALVLLHQPSVLTALDRWIDGLAGEEFRGLLPALRRTFSQFSVGERRKLGALLFGSHAGTPVPEVVTTTDGGELEDLLDEWLTEVPTGRDEALREPREP